MQEKYEWMGLKYTLILDLIDQDDLSILLGDGWWKNWNIRMEWTCSQWNKILEGLITDTKVDNQNQIHDIQKVYY